MIKLTPSNDFLKFLADSKKKYINVDFPSSKNERWKFTPLNRIFDNNFPKSDINSSLNFNFDKKYCELSPLNNDAISNLNNSFFTDNLMTNLSLANFTEGFILNSFKNSNFKNFITLEYKVNDKLWSSPIIIFNISKSSFFKCNINIEITNNSISTPIFVFNMDENSNACIGISISNTSNDLSFDQGKFSSLIYSSLSKNSTLDISIVQHSNKLCRNDINVDMVGKESKFILNGIYLGKKNQHNDITTSINHLNESTYSFQNIRGILDDKSVGVYQGGIFVDRKAQKTDGQQLSRTLMLSKLAESNSKPELRIYADDVSCSHGNTIGDLDVDQLFFLLSRGIDEKQGREILLKAFLSEIVNDLSNDEVKQLINKSLKKWLENKV